MAGVASCRLAAVGGRQDDKLRLSRWNYRSSASASPARPAWKDSVIAVPPRATENGAAAPVGQAGRRSRCGTATGA